MRPRVGRRRGFGHIFKRPGRGGYYLRFSFGGKRMERYAGSDPSEAEAFAAKLEERKRIRGLSEAVSHYGKKATMGEIVEGRGRALNEAILKALAEFGEGGTEHVLVGLSCLGYKMPENGPRSSMFRSRVGLALRSMARHGTICRDTMDPRGCTWSLPSPAADGPPEESRDREQPKEVAVDTNKKSRPRGAWTEQEEQFLLSLSEHHRTLSTIARAMKAEGYDRSTGAFATRLRELKQGSPAGTVRAEAPSPEPDAVSDALRVFIRREVRLALHEMLAKGA